MKKTKRFFTILSILLGLSLVWQWSSIHRSYQPNVNQLETQERAAQFLQQLLAVSGKRDVAAVHSSRVGLFIESLKFSSANDIEVSGHLWQKIAVQDKVSIEPGVIFADAIGDVVFEKRYHESYDDYELHGWYFEATLREPFHYGDYPIDHKTVWIRLKPASFNQAQAMLPDLASYEKTGMSDAFGISPDIVLLGWEINETFFDYMVGDYDTDFGFAGASHHTQIPVLAFNVVLNRNIVTAFITDVTLLLVTMLLLYILVVMITSDKALKSEFELTVGSAVGSCAGLFFAVLLAHIHLREQFPSSGFIYLEFFYLLNYVFITAVAVIVFIFYKQQATKEIGLFRDDAAWVKFLYWPLYFGVANLYTLLHFS